MEVTKDTVLQWLERENHSRDWLAEKCGVKSAAVGNWLGKNSSRPIPAKAVLIISDLMRIDEAKANAAAVVPQNLVLEFTHEEFDTICAAAAACGEIPRKWAEKTLSGIASADVTKLAEELKGKAG